MSVCSLCRLISTRAFSITCHCTRIVGLTPSLPFFLSSFDICWELRRPSWELLVLYKHQLASATIFNRNLVQVEVFWHDLFHKGFLVAEDKLQKTGLVHGCKKVGHPQKDHFKLLFLRPLVQQRRGLLGETEGAVRVDRTRARLRLRWYEFRLARS
jgi:hypothetical protein